MSPAKWAAATALCFAVLLAALNLLNHKMVLLGSVEQDDYFMRADELLRGEGYQDPYHPPLYVVLTAACSLLLRLSTFRAANLISSACAGAIVGLSFLLARFFLRPPYARLAQFLVAANLTVVGQGLSASTDALAAALCLGIILCVVARTHNRPTCSGFRGAIVLGVLFALAFLARYTAASLLPLVVLGLAQGAAPNREKLKMLAVTAVSAMVVLMPWLIYTLHRAARRSPTKTGGTLHSRCTASVTGGISRQQVRVIADSWTSSPKTRLESWRSGGKTSETWRYCWSR
jgi:4-amino-4-deoxy-L-arabinose transferase-like glycosyltransferase